ncbi:Secretory immunoglobulin A-binding protein EsiB [Rhodocyclaceae bacterium]|nr:Secretory immunoglobulin A-binding protein EsiB [Rhodocyclaceae bacterium]
MRYKLIVVSMLLASCSGVTAPALPSITPYKIEIRQGNLVTADMREKIKVGMTTSQVRAALGTPLIADPFHANRWDYQYRYEQEGKLIKQQRLTLYFEGDNLARIDEQDMQPEAVATQASTSSKLADVAPAAAEPIAAVPVSDETLARVAAVSAGLASQAEPAPQAVPVPAVAEPVAAAPAKAEASPQAAEAKGAGHEVNEEYRNMVEQYREGANEGNAEAQYNLGRMYDFGYGVPQDYKVAADWYQKAAKQGYAKAHFNLGVMNDLGRGMNKDEEKAASHYREAAELGDAKAQYILGMMHAKGRGVPQDDKVAMLWYRKAAAQGYEEAQAIVKAAPAPVEVPAVAAAPVVAEAAPQPAKVEDTGPESNAEYKKMVELYRKGAEEGNAEAQYNLGQMYELGYGVPQSYKVASDWYRKAGKLGYAKAFFNLGVMNTLGRGIKKDDKKAAARFREAAELGDAQAQYTLGMMYAKGVGVPKNDKLAMSWYRKAAAQGVAEAEAIVKAAEPVPVAAQPVAAAPAAATAVPPAAEARVEPVPEPAPKVAEAKVEPAPVAEPAAPVPPVASLEAEQTIDDAVKSWAAAWSARDLAQYLASYARTFKPADGMSRKAWEAQRKARVAKPKSIIVELSDITVDKQSESSARVSFKQDYRADSYKDVTNKTLELKKAGNKWLIVSERAEKIEAVQVAASPKAEPAPTAEPAPKPEVAPKAEPAADASRTLSAETKRVIADAVKGWAAAWSGQDVEKYLANYAQSFKPAGGMSRAAWEAQRRERVATPKSINVELSGVTVSGQGEDSARVRFMQNYRADVYQDVTNKTLELKKIGDKWLIVSEQVNKK